MKCGQTTDTAFMVSPDHFGFNEQTANTNPFQIKQKQDFDLIKTVQSEFEGVVEKLRKNSINVIVAPSRKDEFTPDAIFADNWFSTHKSGKSLTLVLYPMLNENRRKERQRDLLIHLLNKAGIKITKEIDFTHYEKKRRALEGNGSIVFDHQNKIAYSALSPRTDKNILNDLCKRLGYNPYIIYSANIKGFPVYHTDMVLNLGSKYAVISSKSIKVDEELVNLRESLQKNGKELIEINIDQTKKMCANIIELMNTKGEPNIILSETAMNAFPRDMTSKLENHGNLIPVKIPTIEKVGGSGAKSIIAEIFH